MMLTFCEVCTSTMYFMALIFCFSGCGTTPWTHGHVFCMYSVLHVVTLLLGMHKYQVLHGVDLLFRWLWHSPRCGALLWHSVVAHVTSTNSLGERRKTEDEDEDERENARSSYSKSMSRDFHALLHSLDYFGQGGIHWQIEIAIPKKFWR